MNTTIKTLLKKTASQAIQFSPASPYAVIEASEISEMGDHVALMLSSDLCPINTLGQKEQSVNVKFDGHAASWIAARGKPAQIGTSKEPLDPRVAQALESESGLLVMFIDEETALPGEDFSVFFASKH